MIIGVLEVDIRLFACNSLKDKRRVLKSLISRIRNNFNVSVAEVGNHTLWQRAQLGIAFLSSDTAYSSKVLDKILDFLKKEKEILIIDCKKEIF